jgi:hypothetical protein
MLRFVIWITVAVVVFAESVYAGQEVTTASGAPTLFEFDGPPVPVAPEVVTRDEMGRATIRAVRVTTPLNIDGRLDEPVYETVRSISDFIQIEPQPGSLATEKTEVWLTFDSEYVYISFRCWESRPELLVANEMRRDNSAIWRGNDIVAFFIDPFYDRRNGFEFTINSIGGRQDGQTSNDRDWNGDWNTVWDFKAGRFEGGWTVEVALPFKSLRYGPGREQLWGFNAFRTNRWKNEISFVTQMPPARGQSALHQASLAATVVGLEAPESSTRLEVKPYVISDLTTDRIASPPVSNDIGGDAGFDVKYGITQNVTADLTVNTDFAQVEADEQQVNLTRFSLFFPEKREFFLENAGLFTFGGATANGDAPLVFYSRRIGLNEGRVVPIWAGGRLTGRLGRFNFGLINAQTDEDPSPVQRDPANFSVVRIKRDILRRSNVGMIFTRRPDTQSGGTGTNVVYGVDSTLGFFTNFTINSYWAQTRSPGLREDDASYRTQLDYTGDRYGLQLERLAIGSNFRPEVGFVRRNNIRMNSGTFRFSPRLPASRTVRKLSWIGSLSHIENGAGRLESREVDGEFAVEFLNSDRLSIRYSDLYENLPRPFEIASEVTLPPGGYEFHNVRVGFNLGEQRKRSGQFLFESGTFYNGNRTAFSVSRGRLNMTARLSAEPTYSMNRVRLVQGSFTTHLAGSRVTYSMTPMMFVSALVQYNSGSHRISANVRLRWEYQPGSEVFVVYNEQRDTLAPGFPVLANRSVIIKLNRLFRF